MDATMMHTPMTVQLILQHGAEVFPDSRVGTFDGESMRYKRYAEIAADAARLAAGLRALGVRPGDRVGTFSWNSTAHLEAYLAIPAMGAIMHTINIRLAAEQIAYVVNHAGDRVVLVDASLWRVFEPVLPLLRGVEHLVVVGGAATAPGYHCARYDELLAAQSAAFDWPTLDERSAAAVCYTSGTTGNPKGVVYSHRTTYVHSLASRATGDQHDLRGRRDFSGCDGRHRELLGVGKSAQSDAGTNRNASTHRPSRQRPATTSDGAVDTPKAALMLTGCVTSIRFASMPQLWDTHYWGTPSMVPREVC